MYVVLFHRFDRLGCNLINYIAQIIYAYHHGYCIKIMDHKENYPKYPNSKYYLVLLNYITNVLNVKNKPTEEILYNCNKFNFDFFLILFIKIIRNYRYKNMIEEIYKDKVDDKLLQ